MAGAVDTSRLDQRLPTQTHHSYEESSEEAPRSEVRSVIRLSHLWRADRVPAGSVRWQRATIRGRLPGVLQPQRHSSWERKKVTSTFSAGEREREREKVTSTFSAGA